MRSPVKGSVIGGAIIAVFVGIVSSALATGILAVFGIRGDAYEDVFPAAAILLWTIPWFIMLGVPGTLASGALVAWVVRMRLDAGAASRGAIGEGVLLSGGVSAAYGAVLGLFRPVGLSPQFLAAVGLFVGVVGGIAVGTATLIDFAEARRDASTDPE